MFGKLVSIVLVLASVVSAANDDNPCSKDQWQCGDKSCIWKQEKCNGILDCPDGSDETQANCQKVGGSKGNCILPPYPDHGTYRANVEGQPGDAHYYLNVNILCDAGYKVKGTGSVHCYNGWWPEQIPKCVYAGGCGIISENTTELLGGKSTKRSQAPWHVDIYDKVIRHSCSGTIIRDDIVLSINSCFWSISVTAGKVIHQGPVPAKDILLVAGNKERIAYNSSEDSELMQHRRVKQIHLANYVPGSQQVKIKDPALLVVDKPFVYNVYIRPVCVDFNINFDRRQLQPGKKGKLPAWGFSRSRQPFADYTPAFDVIDFSFVDSDTCILETDEFIRKFNFVPNPDQRLCAVNKTSDLFYCKGQFDDTASGLVFPEQESDGIERYYLRGILWKLGTDRPDGTFCKLIEGHALFTKLQNYEDFIKKYFKPDSVFDSSQSNKCILPPYPAKGKYVPNIPNAKPGDAYDIISINVTCQEGYVVDGPHLILCTDGEWSSLLPKCVPLCHLPPLPSVEYRCLVSLEWMDGFRACEEFEPSETLVSPICRTHFYSATALKFMHCTDGEWYNVPKCTPECGILTPNGTQLVIGGEAAQVGEVPWHAGIYSKSTNPYKQICGGSIISNKVVISAAHCFWDNLSGKLPASRFAVAVGKLCRRWDSTLDESQKFDVEAIHLPTRFQGSAANFQDDIAVVVLNATIKYETYIRPVCIDFDINFERRQLQPENKGKVAGWGLTAENDNAGSQMLRVVDLPYVTVQTCIKDSPPSFRAHITSDKICAGFNNAGTALCKGDSGGGLAFLELDKGTPRYYLRGVASTAPTNDNLCNANTYTSFTRLITHEHLVNRFWGD